MLGPLREGMATNDVPPQLASLAEKMMTEYRDSEYDIARALAVNDGAMSIEELAEEADYTERTIKKRVGTLEERLGGEPLLRRDEDERPSLHPSLVAAIRAHEDS